MELLKHTLTQVAYALVNPTYSMFLILLGFIFYLKNKRNNKIEYMVMGQKNVSAFELTISQIVIGIFGGALASILITLLGINFDAQSNVYIIFIISIILMMVNPRFICLSYSGAILGLFSLIFSLIGVLINKPEINIFVVDIINLVALIGIMHFVEGILVMVDGKRGAIPIFGSRDNKIVGGFAFKRLWALPVVLLMAIANNHGVTGDVINTPIWWPLLNHKENKILFETVVLAALPLYTVVGYTSVTFTKTKGKKTLMSGLYISLYGLILIILAPIAKIGVIAKFLLILFMPIAHELMLKIQRKREVNGEPIYISDNEGIMILDVAKNSFGEKIGLRSKDIILNINNLDMNDDEFIFKFMEQVPNNLYMEIKRGTEKLFINETVEKKIRPGIVIVPRVIPNKNKVLKIENTFEDILRKIKERDKSDN
ncbi:hypothetical protein [Clostridium sp. ATCC 25772]|uniref:hypothetical protein n=1 Tax=Clostridium sp. ATCC 25772 TaxID=1676991 RepID=UPI000B136860|nr:hypothetical protein [Clostridium sp. ATCC 25772]